jgi:queuosine precursor transporter
MTIKSTIRPGDKFPAPIQSGYKYYSIIALLFIVAEIIGLTLGPRLIDVWGFLLPGGIFFFPLSYFLLDVVTEVYGYKQSRLLIWSNLFAQCAYGGMVYLALLFPPAAILKNSNEYMTVMGNVPYMVIASLLATFSSYFVNAIILAKLKILTKGRCYWIRTISSTAIAEAVFSVVWVMFFFHNILSIETKLWLIISQYILKVSYEILATPFTYLAAGFLKKHDGVDRYDYHTKFKVFSLELYDE